MYLILKFFNYNFRSEKCFHFKKMIFNFSVFWTNLGPISLLANFFYFWTNLGPILVELMVEHIICKIAKLGFVIIGPTMTFYYR